MSIVARSATATPRDWIARLPGILLSVVSLEILLAKLVAVMIGGSSAAGKVVDSHYFLGAPNGSTVEVSRALYELSLILGWSVLLTLAILVVAVVLAGSRRLWRGPRLRSTQDRDGYRISS